MAEMLRIFVQLADLTGKLGEANMAFISPVDQWNSVIKELLLSCLEEDAAVTEETIRQCRVLELPRFNEIVSTTAICDGSQYVVCPSKNIFLSILSHNNVTNPEFVMLNHDDSMSVENNVSNSNSNLESLENLSYFFDNQGTLRNSNTNEAVSGIMDDETKVNQIDEIVKAAIFHIQMEMMADLDFQQLFLPLGGGNNSDQKVEAKCCIFVSRDWLTCNNLLVIVNSGRGIQPGVWSRDLLIQEGLEFGSMLPCFRRAQKHAYGVVVLNPSTNSVTIKNVTYPIHGNSSSEEHLLYAWDKILSKSKAKNVFMLGYNFGAKLIIQLLKDREEEVFKKLKAIVFAEGAFRLNEETSKVRSFLNDYVLNFKSDNEIAAGCRIPALEESLGCACISAGCLDSTSLSSKNSNASSRKSSNKARTIRQAMDCIFAFYEAINSNPSTTTDMFAPKNKLKDKIRQRLDSLTPKRSRVGSNSSTLSTLLSIEPKKMDYSKDTGEEKNNTFARRSSGKNVLSSVDESKSCLEDTNDRNGSRVNVNDFILLKVVGKGCIGKVFLVRKISDQNVYAMKVLKKRSVVAAGLEKHIKTERLILEEINHPFIARLRYSFQTKDKLYLVTDYCSGGELFHHLSDSGFEENRAKFYAAEIVSGLAHLHSLEIAYRDLKPENLLIDELGHIRITDFGLSKMNVIVDGGAQSIVGSAEYLAPEIYSMKKYGFSVDWWSLGVLIYELIIGTHPFYDDNKKTMVKNIMIPNYVEKIMPEKMPEDAADLVKNLLQHDPEKRLGFHGAHEIKSHCYFKEIDWSKLEQKKIKPPWAPMVLRDSYVGNFDSEFTSQSVAESIHTPISSMMISATFDDFSFDSRKT